MVRIYVSSWFCVVVKVVTLWYNRGEDPAKQPDPSKGARQWQESGQTN